MAILDTLATQLPAANKKLQQQQQATTALQLQQAVKQAPATQNVTQLAQQLGGAAQQNIGQQMVETAKQNLSQQAQLGQDVLQQQKQDILNQLTAVKQGQAASRLNDEQQLANISEAAKKEMYDSRMQFKQDELGRVALNERQLADYAVKNAQSVQQLNSYIQSAELLHNRNIQALRTASNRIEEELKYQHSLGEAYADRKLQAQLMELKRAADEKANREAHKQKMKTQTFTTVGMVAGAVVGGVIGGSATYGTGTAAGATTGAAAGASLGTAIGGALSAT